MDNEHRLEIAIRAAVAAGNTLIQHYDDKLHVSKKESLRDIVTEIDKIAESQVIGILQSLPDETAIISEEAGLVKMSKSERSWVIDALDGTVNYVNHIPFFAVSIALIEKGEPTIGVIYNPMSSDLYYGAEGIGVFKNQSALRVTKKNGQDCLFSVAFSGKNYHPQGRKDEFLLMGRINDDSRGCLRTGSASMNLAYLAEGRLGGCWGKANKVWDIAAGLLLAKLAGARVQKTPLDPLKGQNNNFVNYIAAASSAWDILHKNASAILGLE